jgi:hypothetical protein
MGIGHLGSIYYLGRVQWVRKRPYTEEARALIAQIQPAHPCVRMEAYMSENHLDKVAGIGHIEEGGLE